jgi:hypothetical protein
VARQMPDLHFRGPLHFASLEEEVEAACATLEGEAELGFDLEWTVRWLCDHETSRPKLLRPTELFPTRIEQVTYRSGEAPRPAALIQLCVPSTSGCGWECYLLHVARTGITRGLRRLLEAASPLKVGVNISADAQKLYRDHQLVRSPLGAVYVWSPFPPCVRAS